jgi:hypothetical protein
VGVLSYGLLFAFVESVLLFLVAAVLGLIIPRRWEPDRRIAVLSALVLILTLWAMVEQLFFLMNVQVHDAIIDLLVRSGHPLRIMYPAILGIVGASFLLPVWAIWRTSRGARVMGALIDRLGLLAILYLVFDAAALVIVIIRNV